MERVAGKTILITGGASGIGAACARMLVAEGANVVLTDIDDSAGKALAMALGSQARYARQDVRDEAAWDAVIETTVQTFGRLDVLINNAGIAEDGPIEEQSLEDWRTLMAINNDAVFLGCKAAITAMKNNAQQGRGGSIINMSSVHGIKAAAYAPSYSASKGAVRLLTKAVAQYCAQLGYGIRCNSVHPGYVMTPLLEKAFERSENGKAMYQMIVDQHPLGRLGTPEDVAHAVVYLASDEAAFVTGSELVIDGGYLL